MLLALLMADGIGSLGNLIGDNIEDCRGQPLLGTKSGKVLGIAAGAAGGRRVAALVFQQIVGVMDL